MNQPKNVTLLSLCSAAAILAASPAALAHTRLEIPTVVEGTTNGHAQVGKVINYVVISHGCPDIAPGTARQPTYGTSVVFPNAISYSPIIGVDSGAGVVYTTTKASDLYSPLAGIGQIIRGGGPWRAHNNKADTLGNVDGFWAGGDNYDQTISTPVNIPFYTHAMTINPKSCARTVTFELAIADFCNNVATPSAKAKDHEVLYWSPIPNFLGVPGQPFGAPTGDATRKIPVAHAYSNYDGYADAAHTIPGDGWGSPATLTVTRNLATNPLPANCTGNAGKGDDYYVYSSAEQINKELPVWSNPDQTGTNYWK
jgi:hypothetical protein